MNIIIDPKYGNTISSNEFGYTFFLKSNYSTKYKRNQYSLFTAPTFQNGKVDWDRQVSITEWDLDIYRKEALIELGEIWSTLLQYADK